MENCLTYNPIEHIFQVPDESADSRLINLENYELLVELWQNIGTNQTGQIITPQESTLEEGAYSDNQNGVEDEDGIVAYLDLSGKASDIPAKTSSGEFIYVNTMDSVGNYTLTGIPSTNSAIYFVVRIKIKDWANLSGFNIATYRTLIPDENVSKQLYYATAVASKLKDPRFLEDNNIFTNESGFIVPFNARLKQIIAVTKNIGTWDVEIYNNNNLLSGAILNIINKRIEDNSYSIDVLKGDEISIYANNIINDMQAVKVTVIFEKK